MIAPSKSKEGSTSLRNQPDNPSILLVEPHHWNALYLLSALCLILMTLSLGTQPLYLRTIHGHMRELENSAIIDWPISGTVDRRQGLGGQESRGINLGESLR